MGTALALSDLLQLIQAIAVLLTLVFSMFKLGGAVTKFENIGRQQAAEIAELKASLQSLNRLMTEMAVSTTRQDEFAKRLGQTERLIEDMRRGEGFILPLSKSPHER